jgi:hypothetical protein
VTYTSPHRWLPGFVPEDGSEAVRAFVRRYLRAFGPATPEHFARWMGATPRGARELFATMGDELEPVDVDGDRAWVAAGDTDVPSSPSRGVRLLPYFDAYVVAGQPRARLFPGAAATRALTPSGQAGNYPVVLIDGVAGGVWHHRRTGRRVEITVEPMGELTPTQRRELEAEAALVARVLEGDPVLKIGTVTVGAHA